MTSEVGKPDLRTIAGNVVYDACEVAVTQVLEDENYLDKWSDDDIDEAVYYMRMFILEVLVNMKYKPEQLKDSKGKFDALQEDEMENYAMDAIDMVRTFRRGY